MSQRLAQGWHACKQKFAKITDLSKIAVIDQENFVRAGNREAGFAASRQPKVRESPLIDQIGAQNVVVGGNQPFRTRKKAAIVDVYAGSQPPWPEAWPVPEP